MRTHFLCLCCVSLFFFACSQENPTQPEPRSVTAQTMRLGLTTAQECRTLSGQVRSRNSVMLASKISGTVTAIQSEEGAAVQPGQVIVRIDDAELRQREQSLAATASQANLERQALVARRSQAGTTLERLRSVLGTHAASQEEVDRAQAEYDALVHQEKALAAQATAAHLQSAEVRSLLRYSTLSSPVHGVLTRRHVDLGTFVQAGSPVAEIEDLRSGFDLEARADESLLGLVQPGMTVLTVLPAIRQEPLVSTLSAVVDQVEPASRSFRIKANVDGSARAGMFGTICIPMPESEKLLVPLSALRPRGELMTAFVLDEQDTLRLRLIKIGALYQKIELDGQAFILQARTDQSGQAYTQTEPGNAEILAEVRSGLFAGEEIVCAAPDTAREGDRLVRR